MSNGTGITLTGNLNKINLFADKNTWLSQPLKDLKANKVMDMSYVYMNNDNAARFCLAEKDGKMYPYADGFFYQNEGNHRVVDSSCVKLLWSNNDNTLGAFDCYLNDNLTNYDFIIIHTTHGSSIFSTSRVSGDIMYVGWDGNVNADRCWSGRW